MKFEADKAKAVMAKGRIIKFEKTGFYETNNKDEIEALKKAKGVTVVKGKAEG